MGKAIFILRNDYVRSNAIQAIQNSPSDYVVTIQEPKRSLEQNALLWSCLHDVSRQVPWVVNGQQAYLSPEDWKDVFTVNLTRENRIAQGIDGGVVLLGRRTSKMSKSEMTDLISLIHAFGDEKGVIWSPTSLGGVYVPQS